MPRDYFTNGQPVLVNTGGDDSPGTVENTRCPYPALGDCVLIRFENQTAQWIGRHQIRPTGTEPVKETP